MRQKRTENIDLDNISLISNDDGNAGGQHASSAELMHQANLLLTGGAAPELNKPAVEPLFRDASTLPHQA